MAMGEMMGITPTYDVNNNSDGGMNGNGSWIWVILFIILLGGRGNGLFGGGNGEGSAVRQDLSNDFLYSNLNNSIGRLADATANGFTGVNNGLCNLGYENLSNFKDAQAQAAACCCETNRNIDAVRYEAAKNTCDIIVAGDRNTDRIINHLTQQEMQNLRDGLNTANLQLSQQAQSANLINQLKPCAIPAYITCSPYEHLGGGFRNGFNDGCGC